MAKLLVLGSVPKESGVREVFGQALGREIVERGHVLLGGCRSDFDAAVAVAAGEAASAKGLDPRAVVHSWILGGSEPAHEVGEITRSVMQDWHSLPTGLAFPEQINQSNAVILVGGGRGTQAGATWSRFARKPLLPLGTFGLAGEEVFKTEMSRFETEYAGHVTREEYQVLNRFLPRADRAECADLVTEVVGLAEKVLVSSEVFVVMSFSDEPHLVDAYDTFCSACSEFGLTALRVDDTLSGQQRIIPTMLDAIRRSAFVIADVSVPSTNVFYELGYAQALNKPVIVTAHEGTELPFDIADVPAQFWSSQKELRAKLVAQIASLRR